MCGAKNSSSVRLIAALAARFRGSVFRLDERRIALGEFKDKLTASLKLDEDEGETEAFLRRGYQRMTWWEEDKDREEKSDDWRR